MTNNNLYYAFITIFAIIGYMIVVDKNVATYIILLYKLLQVNIRRFIFWIQFYPKLRYDTWKLKRSMKQFIKEMNQDTSGDNNI